MRPVRAHTDPQSQRRTINERERQTRPEPGEPHVPREGEVNAEGDTDDVVGPMGLLSKCSSSMCSLC
jgi:hypothetical protein